VSMMMGRGIKFPDGFKNKQPRRKRRELENPV